METPTDENRQVNNNVCKIPIIATQSTAAPSSTSSGKITNVQRTIISHTQPSSHPSIPIPDHSTSDQPNRSL
uniref:Uncharacterized protein n=1 Tax=Anguilla anguilla TaxID=7936 RepID=A0A0E9TWG0_ANGAN